MLSIQDEPGILFLRLKVSSASLGWNYYQLSGNDGARYGLTAGMRAKRVRLVRDGERRTIPYENVWLRTQFKGNPRLDCRLLLLLLSAVLFFICCELACLIFRRAYYSLHLFDYAGHSGQHLDYLVSLCTRGAACNSTEESPTALKLVDPLESVVVEETEGDEDDGVFIDEVDQTVVTTEGSVADGGESGKAELTLLMIIFTLTCVVIF